MFAVHNSSVMGNGAREAGLGAKERKTWNSIRVMQCKYCFADVCVNRVADQGAEVAVCLCSKCTLCI